MWGGLADLAEGSCRRVVAIDRPAGGSTAESAIREDQIALRDQAVYVPRLVDAPSSRRHTAGTA